MIFDKIKEIRAAMEQELQEAASSEQLRDLKVKFWAKKAQFPKFPNQWASCRQRNAPRLVSW